MMGSFQNWLATAITCSAEHCLGEGVGATRGMGRSRGFRGSSGKDCLGAGLCASEVGVKCVSG